MTSLTEATNSGFNYLYIGEPLRSGYGVVHAPMIDVGPYNSGAGFDFQFNSLAAGEKKVFTMYYGAASGQAEAEQVTANVGAEVYAFAKPTDVAGICTSTTNVFIMAFKDVGGQAIKFN